MVVAPVVPSSFNPPAEFLANGILLKPLKRVAFPGRELPWPDWKKLGGRMYGTETV